jgi:hypothetical protein
VENKNEIDYRRGGIGLLVLRKKKSSIVVVADSQLRWDVLKKKSTSSDGSIRAG